MGFLPYSPQFCTHSFTIARGPMDLVVFLIYGMENLPLWYYPNGAQKRGVSLSLQITLFVPFTNL